ncbi:MULTISPECIES: TetR/AcrR family transcriptional regulator [unclassified Crossiella]|uniref:TetR/AcrR family transcriptional regulator n=1 Tax=unclassified Crossiella TaxID=2620835 RepID=UPI001FFFF525|nr:MULTISPECIES: TetR/AcrR family transcriptional regulator [unclassified Crossiella]MCK2244030.1 TetR/AcrR family transcriptional regulator [Crossiella sp. S99.2]MCK2257112.1 TetR/AcrR family transcriptional regulator [Crossiella sp. S99.1]
MSTDVKVSEPRERLLATASELFYAEGIQAIGVDRLVKEASVTRATFYRHFPTKEDLVVAYLRGKHEEIRGGVEAAVAGQDPATALHLMLGAFAQASCGPGFRGCAFLNAAAEYPDPQAPVRVLVREHRGWFHDGLRGRLTEAGHPDPGHAATALVLLRDGIMSGGYLDQPADIQSTVDRMVDGVLAGNC